MKNYNYYVEIKSAKPNIIEIFRDYYNQNSKDDSLTVLGFKLSNFYIDNYDYGEFYFESDAIPSLRLLRYLSLKYDLIKMEIYYEFIGFDYGKIVLNKLGNCITSYKVNEKHLASIKLINKTSHSNEYSYNVEDNLDKDEVLTLK